MISLELPIPPSINAKYMVQRGRLILSPTYRSYKSDVGSILGSYRIVPKDVQIHMVCEFAFGRDRDIDSGLKCLLDTLEGHLYENDSQIISLAVTKSHGNKTPGVVVTITPLNTKKGC